MIEQQNYSFPSLNYFDFFFETLVFKFFKIHFFENRYLHLSNFEIYQNLIKIFYLF